MKNLLAMTAIAFGSLVCMAQTDWNTNSVGAAFARQGGETPAGTYRFTCGGYEVFTINTSDKDWQPASIYYGKDDADKEFVDNMAPDGKVPTAMNCFVVNTPQGYLMFDTGIPESKGGRTVERLAALQIKTEDIKAIFLTHGHFDHIGGLIDDTGNAVYSSATLYFPVAELDFIRSTSAEAAGQIERAYADRLVTFTDGILPYNVLPLPAPGHTPGHTAYQVGKLLFIGDLMHGISIQLINPSICAFFDADKSKAISSRNVILDYAIQNSLTVLCAHAPLNGVVF